MEVLKHRLRCLRHLEVVPQALALQAPQALALQACYLVDSKGSLRKALEPCLMVYSCVALVAVPLPTSHVFVLSGRVGSQVRAPAGERRGSQGRHERHLH